MRGGRVPLGNEFSWCLLLLLSFLPPFSLPPQLPTSDAEVLCLPFCDLIGSAAFSHLWEVFMFGCLPPFLSFLTLLVFQTYKETFPDLFFLSPGTGEVGR